MPSQSLPLRGKSIVHVTEIGINNDIAVGGSLYTLSHFYTQYTIRNLEIFGGKIVFRAKSTKYFKTPLPPTPHSGTIDTG